MAKQKILAVDDERHILELISYNLAEAGYEVETVETGEEALSKTAEFHPDLILLDVMLPDIDGLQVCTRLKRDPDTAGIPVIMLTARGDEIDKVLGLEMGADDYVVKPFGVRELVARVKALLRRSGSHKQEEQPTQLSAAGITLDLTTYHAMAGGERLQLTLKEFELLRTLIQNKGRILNRDQLLNKVWGYEYFGETRTVDVHIRHLRQKLGALGQHIETVRGLGYMFNELERE
ncbi:MAG: response regulator transcription factor [Clostridiales bacterium]|jgi:DNA-binding response regulator|nr:response regulator transcription factor [Clostridiales bacterium]